MKLSTERAARLLREASSSPPREVEENRRFRNGLDNLLAALDAAPGLPIECLSEEDQEKWTDAITGILMALGPYRISGRPETLWENISSPPEGRKDG